MPYIHMLLRRHVDDAHGLDAHNALAESKKLQLCDMARTRNKGSNSCVCAEADDLGAVRG